MKTILLLIHDDDGQEARIRVALDVVRAIKGHLVCLDVAAIPQYVSDYVGNPGCLFAEEQLIEAENKARVMGRLEQEDIPFDWLDRTGPLAQTIENNAGLSDLVVLSSDAHGTLFPRRRHIVDLLSVKSGKPLLVVPPVARPLNLEGDVIMAWDGSRHAEAALLAARPLLQRAKTVTLFCIEDGFTKLPVQDAAYYLSRYNLHPIKKSQPLGVSRPGTAILREVCDGHYDYVVMGAYSHDPAVEAIFGGTTRTMLKKSPVPILLAHHR